MPARSVRLVICSAVAAASACSRQPGRFLRTERPRPRRHARRNHRQPARWDAGQRPRARYIIDQLKLFGFEVRVQDTDARRVSSAGPRASPTSSRSSPADGRKRLASSRTTTRCRRGPGAGDDAFGVGVALEAARVLAARADRNWTLMVLVTDGEEAG